MTALSHIPLLRTPHDRVNALLAHKTVLQGDGVIEIFSTAKALEYGDGWLRQYRHLEAAHTLACEQLRASEILLAHAQEELERVRGAV